MSEEQTNQLNLIKFYVTLIESKVFQTQGGQEMLLLTDVLTQSSENKQDCMTPMSKPQLIMATVPSRRNQFSENMMSENMPDIKVTASDTLAF